MGRYEDMRELVTQEIDKWVAIERDASVAWVRQVCETVQLHFRDGAEAPERYTEEEDRRDEALCSAAAAASLRTAAWRQVLAELRSIPTYVEAAERLDRLRAASDDEATWWAQSAEWRAQNPREFPPATSTEPSPPQPGLR